ncbi:MAG: ATP-binding protein [Deltaproteobacteria bacterium]|nr:ATP-binding protein [Deltaproteobacteria bacterium]
MVEYISRYNSAEIEEDLQRKMVFLAGPRQVGKTTFGKGLLKNKGGSTKIWYKNWDAPDDREQIIQEHFPAGKGLLVLDEIHKFSRWRQVVKGLYDKRHEELQILVTGSARLDLYRHGGDSLQGRYHFHRLHILSMAELKTHTLSDLESLLRYGGFPEPFFGSSDKESARWSREYRSRLIREDLQDLERVKDIALIERMVMRMPELVGAPLSVNSLREDLQVAHKTVARWLMILENLYMIFRIYPFGAPGMRAVKKEAKHYHMDWTVVKDMAFRFENLTACHLLKWCHFMQDTQGRDCELMYFRDIDRREVDFVITEDGKPIHFIECKKSFRRKNTALRYLVQRFPQTKATQISMESGETYTDKDGIVYQNAAGFLASLV